METNAYVVFAIHVIYILLVNFITTECFGILARIT